MSFHNVHVRAFVHATESEEKVCRAMAFIVGDSDIKRIGTEGHFGNPLIILEANVKRKKDIRDFFDRIGGSSLAPVLLKELEMRVDEDCNLYFKLDKQKALGEEAVLVTEGDVIACKLKIAAYPATRENAMPIVRKFLEKLGKNR